MTPKKRTLRSVEDLYTYTGNSDTVSITDPKTRGDYKRQTPPKDTDISLPHKCCNESIFLTRGQRLIGVIAVLFCIVVYMVGLYEITIFLAKFDPVVALPLWLLSTVILIWLSIIAITFVSIKLRV